MGEECGDTGGEGGNKKAKKTKGKRSGRRTRTRRRLGRKMRRMNQERVIRVPIVPTYSCWYSSCITRRMRGITKVSKSNKKESEVTE